MINALLVSGGSFQGSTLIKGLKRSSQICIHIADCFSDNINKYECEQFHKVPLLSKEGDFLSKIKQIAIGQDIHVIFPSTDHELQLLAKHKKSIEKTGAKIAVCDAPLNDILTHKIKTHNFLKEHGFPLLDAVNIENKSIRYPILGKPAHGFGSKGIIVLRNQEEHHQALKSINTKDFLWLPFIENFDEFSIDFAISFDHKISTITIRKRIRTSGGFAVITQREINKAIEHQVARLSDVLRENGGYGIFNVQVIKQKNGELHFSDINPRVGTSSVFTLGTGVNLPLFMCFSLKEKPNKEKIGYRTSSKVKMVRNLSERWISSLPKDKIKGVVFDLDDTLIDQKVWIFDKLRIVYKQHTRHLPKKETFLFAAHQFFEEGKRGTLIDELKSKFNLSEQLRDELIQSFRQAEPNSIRVYRDVVPNLTRLKQQGLKIGLLTDNPVRSQQQKINKLSFSNLFDTIVYSMEFEKEKPDKFLFETISEKLGVHTHNLAMVGDNLYRDCYGSINAEYLAAFFIERKEGFFNFNYSYFLNTIKLPMEKIVRIASLNDLYYGLEDNHI